MHPMRRYAALLDTFYATSWAIMPEKYEAIARIVEDLEQGLSIDTETARVRLETDSELMAKMGYKSDEDKPYRVIDNVAVVPMVGTILKRPRLFGEMSGLVSADKVRLDVEAAMRDDSVKAVVLNSSSPGGQVEGISESSRSIRDYRGTKPLIAVSNGLMASAAYWIASAADEIVVNADGLVGSIGVLGTHADISKFDEKMGIKRTMIGVPSGKSLGRENAPLNEKAYARKMKVVSDLFGVFAGDVAANRDMTVDAIKALDADIFVGSEAVKQGLANRIGTLDEVIAELAKGKRVSAAVPSANGHSDNLTREATMKWYLLTESYAGHAAGEAIELDAEKGDKLVAAGVCEAISAEAAKAINGRTRATETSTDTTTQSTAREVADRHATIRSQCRTLFPDRDTADAFSDQLIAGNPDVSIEEASRSITEELCKLRQPIGSAIVPGRSAREKFSQAFSDGMAIRMMTAGDIRQEENMNERLAVGALGRNGEYRVDSESFRIADMSLLQMARECLRHEGVQNVYDLDSVDIANLALGVNTGDLNFQAAEFHTPSSFTNLLSTSINKVVRSEFMLANTTYQVWCRIVSDLRDFRQQERPRLGETADLAIKPDGEKYPDEQLDDSVETYRPYEYGRKFSFTRQTIMNDDTGTLNNPSRFARGAARTINRAAIGILTANDALSDNIALFHADHNNLVSSGGAPSVAQLTNIRELFRLQTGSKSQAILNLRMRYILSPAALETEFEELETSTIVPIDNRANRNIFGPGGRTRWSALIDPDLDANSSVIYYGICDPMDATLVEVGFVRGFRTPRVESQRNFDTKGLEFTVETAFGVKALDYQAGVRNPGA